MIAKMGKRKQDDSSYQLLYKQIDDLFCKDLLVIRGDYRRERGRIGQRLIHRKYGAPIGPRSKQRLRSARPRDTYR